MAGKRPFAQHRAVAVGTLAGPLHRARRQPPQGAAHLRRPHRRRGVGCRGAAQDRPRPVERHRRRPPRAGHVRRLRGPLAGQSAGLGPTHQGAHPRRTIRRSSTSTCVPAFGRRQLAAIKPKDVRDWHEATLADRPTLRSHAYSLLRTIMASAVNEELLDANPARIVGAGRAKRVHQIRPASVAELGELTAAMPERLRLMVTLASGARCGSARSSNYAAATSI